MFDILCCSDSEPIGSPAFIFLSNLFILLLVWLYMKLLDMFPKKKEVINIISGFCFAGLLVIGLAVITVRCLLSSHLDSYEKYGLLILSAAVFFGGYFFLKDAIISDYKKIKNQFSKRG